jgi:hypothetical protein
MVVAFVWFYFLCVLILLDWNCLFSKKTKVVFDVSCLSRGFTLAKWW